MTHIDDWIQSASLSGEPDKRYAAIFFMIARLSGVMAVAFEEAYGPQKPLYCTYQEVRYRCMGASRLGDIWLSADFNRQMGYDKRVDVAECTNWGREP